MSNHQATSEDFVLNALLHCCLWCIKHQFVVFFSLGYWESQEWWLSPKEGLLAKPEGHLWPPLQLEVVLAIQYTKVCIFQIISALCVTTEDLREWLIVLTNMSYYTLDDVLLLFYFYMILILWYCYELFLLP